MISQKFAFWNPCFIYVSDITTKMRLLPCCPFVAVSLTADIVEVSFVCFGNTAKDSGWDMAVVTTLYMFRLDLWDTSHNFVSCNEVDHSSLSHKRHCISKTYAVLCHHSLASSLCLPGEAAWHPRKLYVRGCVGIVEDWQGSWLIVNMLKRLQLWCRKST